MNGLNVLLYLCIGLAPLVPACIWFRVKKYGVLRFLLSAAAGILTVFAAALVQGLIPVELPGLNRINAVLFGVFVRVSLIEEASRAVILFALLRFIPYSRIYPEKDPIASDKNPALFFGAPSGLAAGLGFAAGESVIYGLANPGAVLLRVFTAAPLHAACGARIGSAAGKVLTQPFYAAILFMSAVLIHGVYNFSIQNPATPAFLPVLIAIAAFGSSLHNIYWRSHADIY